VTGFGSIMAALGVFPLFFMKYYYRVVYRRFTGITMEKEEKHLWMAWLGNNIVRHYLGFFIDLIFFFLSFFIPMLFIFLSNIDD
jgi:hypothetical protein